MDIQTIFNRNIRSIWGKTLKGTDAQPKSVSNVKTNTAEESEIISFLNEARIEWQENLTKFDCVYEEKLVDYYIYRIKACEARYSYFLTKAKELHILKS